MAARSLLGKPWVQEAAAVLAALYIRLVWATSRWETRGGEHPAALHESGAAFIVCFWHGRMLMLPKGWTKGRPVSILISPHRDGRLIAATIRHFGVGTVTGSTSRGGARAFLEMRSLLSTGTSIGITPDGPRGPRMRAAAGVAELARLSGAVVLPAAYAVKRRRVLGTWDRFLLPWPFNRGVFLWDAPIRVAHDADANAVDAARAHIEARLNAITAEADACFGHAATDPAPSGLAPTRVRARTHA
jgi:lysophospholipid acyltransferase (LPLAT)-like uncharacterized protein